MDIWKNEGRKNNRPNFINFPKRTVFQIIITFGEAREREREKSREVNAIHRVNNQYADNEAKKGIFVGTYDI